MTINSLIKFTFFWFLVSLHLIIFSYICQLLTFLLGIVSSSLLAFSAERLFFLYLQFLGVLYKFLVLCMLNLCCKYFLSAFSVSINFATGYLLHTRAFHFYEINPLFFSIMTSVLLLKFFLVFVLCFSCPRLKLIFSSIFFRCFCRLYFFLCLAL